MPLKQPLLPTRLMTNKDYIVVVIVGTVGQMVYYSLNVLWPQQIASLYSTDNATIGWMSCTTGAALAVGEILTGSVFKVLGHAKWQLLAATIGLAIFLGVMAATNQSTQSLAIAVSPLHTSLYVVRFTC